MQRCPVDRLKRAVSVRVDPARYASTTVRGRYVHQRTIVVPDTPKCGSRAMRQHRVRSAGQNGGHPPSGQVHVRMPSGEDAVIHPVQSTNLDSLLHGGSAQSQALELLKRNQSVLAGSNSSYLPVPRRRGPPPTGRKVHSGSTFRPVGGRGWSGHASRVKARGARVVRGVSQLTPGKLSRESRVHGWRVPRQAGPGRRKPAMQSIAGFRGHRPAQPRRRQTGGRGDRARFPGVVTSSRPCPACRHRASRPVPSPAAPRSRPR